MTRADDLILRLEARDAPLYHFISNFDKLGEILKDGFLSAHLSWDNPQRLLDQDKRGTVWGVSLTRDANLGKSLTKDPWGPVRLTLDQDKLAARFKLVPYNYFHHNPSSNPDFKDEPGARAPVETDEPHWVWSTESEEIVATGEDGLKNVWRYVTKVDLLEPEVNKLPVDKALALTKYLDQLNRLGVPWSYVKTFKGLK